MQNNPGMDNIEQNIAEKNLEDSDYKPFVEKSFLREREREIETIFSLGNGYIGTRNSLEEGYRQSDPGSLLAGMYVQAPDDEFNLLVKIPDWTSIKIYAGGDLLNVKNRKVIEHLRYIDFKTGTAVREWIDEDIEGRITNIKIIKYVSLANKNELGKFVVIKPKNYSEKIRVITGINCDEADFKYLLNMNIELENYASIYMRAKHSDKEFVLLQKSIFDSPGEEIKNVDYYIENMYSGSYENFEWETEIGKNYVIKSLCCICNSDESDNIVARAKSAYEKYEEDFFDESFKNHCDKWTERFLESRIKIGGCENDQKLVDFAAYHLIIAGEFSGNNYSIGARSLSGEAYKGHVFWDTEMYLVPFYIYTKPEIARALLMYRYNTLDGARQNAVEEGYTGASYAWESTDTGVESTPELVILPDGEVVRILSGKYENHISANIACTVWKYWQATLDEDFLINYGAEIVFESARYYASRSEKGDDGLYHINKTIGPDEYHECIDDNAYTNYLAEKNFNYAVIVYELMKSSYADKLKDLSEKINLSEEEIESWKDYEGNFYLGYDPDTMLYEQFRGFYDLEYIDLEEYEPRSAPMDIILGREKTKNSQVIKQADVLMFMMLFGEDFSKEQLVKNYEFYEKRCGHGSSLSPNVHSTIAARAGKKQDAYKYFLKNAKIDIGDEFGNASSGIHIAAIGGVWMSIVFGFAGMYSTDKGLIFDPDLPEAWENIDFSIKWRGQKINVNLCREKMKFFIEGNEPVHISVGFDNWREITPNFHIAVIKENEKWRDE